MQSWKKAFKKRCLTLGYKKVMCFSLTCGLGRDESCLPSFLPSWIRLQTTTEALQDPQSVQIKSCHTKSSQAIALVQILILLHSLAFVLCLCSPEEINMCSDYRS